MTIAYILAAFGFAIAAAAVLVAALREGGVARATASRLGSDISLKLTYEPDSL